MIRGGDTIFAGDASTSGIALAVNGLEKKYKERVFKNISFELEKGGGIGITGGNGSGKTTLLNIIAGLDRADAGTVTKHCTFGYVMQKDGLFERLSVRDNLSFSCGLQDVKAVKSRVDELIELFGMGDFAKKKLVLCSAGMRQRVNIASAMVHKPKLLLLDEAASALDAVSRETLKKALLRLKCGQVGMLIVSHQNEELKGLCERLLNIETGLMTDV